jgi:spore maturation protein CgeB
VADPSGDQCAAAANSQTSDPFSLTTRRPFPSVRLFEAAACGATIVSDNWPGHVLCAGREILLPSGGSDVTGYISECDTLELRRIGDAARERVLVEHTSDRRAQEFEQAVETACAKRERILALEA